MDPQFWHEMWTREHQGFHEAAPNALLTRHIGALNLSKSQRVFLPLCGKTRDIGWLMGQGVHVLGAELSKRAITDLFDDLGITPTITTEGPVTRYAAENIDVFVGDIFDVTPDQLGPVDAVYDRAALVALPTDIRNRYAAHLATLARDAPRLVICFTYDQTLMDGPPFSIDAGEVHRLFAKDLNLTPLETVDVVGGLKGRAKATETIWHLTSLRP